MAEHPLAKAVRQFLRSLAPHGGEQDFALLDRFAHSGEEEAFALLLERHGPMVWRTCQRLVHQPADAEDAFQATFLVLCRKARSIGRRESLGGWLHRVAYRIALKARARSISRPLDEGQLPTHDPDPTAACAQAELRLFLDEALSRLPAKYRVPLVLCCLEGKSRARAAAELGWAEGTLSSRLARGKDLLRAYLQRRGLVPSAGAVATLLAQEGAVQAVPRALVQATLKGNSVFLLSGAAGAGGAAVRAVLLAHGALRAMALTKLKITAGVLLGVGLLGLGAGKVTLQVFAEKPVAGGPAAQATSGPPPAPAERPEPTAARTDRYGDPLPEGVLARLGTWRFRAAGGISLIAFLPDNKTLLTVELKEHATHFCRTWDMATGKPLRAFGELPGFLRIAALSPNAKLLATVAHHSATQNDRLVLWDVASGTIQRSLETPDPNVSAIAFSPDGKTLASASAQAIRFWDLESGTEVRHYPAQQDHWGRLTFSPDGGLLALGSHEHISLWDTKTGKELQRWSAHPDAQFKGIGALVFSPDGTQLASTGVISDTVRLWDVATGKRVREFVGKHIASLAFSPNGKFLAAGQNMLRGDPDGSLWLWEVATGKAVHHQKETNSYSALAFSADGKLLALGGSLDIQLLDLATRKPLPAYPEPRGVAWSIAHSPLGPWVATGNSDGTLILWERATGRRIRQFGQDPSMRLPCVAFSPDGQMLVSAGDGSGVRLWDVANGQEIRRLPGKFEAFCAALSPDGRTLVTSGREKAMRLWETATGKELRQIQGPHGLLSWARFSPDGKWLAALSVNVAGSISGALLLWDAGTGKEIRRWELPQMGLFAFSPDGKTLALVEESPATPLEAERTVHLLNLATGRDQRFTLPRKARAFCNAFSPDGKTFAVGRNDGSIYLSEVATGQVRQVLEGHESEIHALTFSPDGTTLISGSSDTTALVWDLTAGAGSDRSRRPLSPQALDDLWATLAVADAAKAYRAVQTLAAAPRQAAGLLKERLRLIAPVDQRRVERLLADLNSDRFAVRAEAEKELKALGELTGPAVRQALEKKPPLEVRLRLERLQEQSESVFITDPERLRAVRAVEVLENAGTPEAQEVLKTLAGGAPGARLTEEAKASLGRLARRPAAAP
jgi:RNA polymerase sigma factor (sigma-70 family)